MWPGVHKQICCIWTTAVRSVSSWFIHSCHHSPPSALPLYLRRSLLNSLHPSFPSGRPHQARGQGRATAHDGQGSLVPEPPHRVHCGRADRIQTEWRGLRCLWVERDHRVLHCWWVSATTVQLPRACSRPGCWTHSLLAPDDGSKSTFKGK